MNNIPMKKILITIPERTIEQLKDIAEEIGEYKGPCPNKSRAIRIAVNYYWKNMTQKGVESERIKIIPEEFK